MNETLIYTLPQWFIFAAVFAVVYGWIESKRVFRVTGAALFVALGFFAVFVLSGNYFENAQLPAGNDADEISFKMKLFPAYLSFVFAALPAIIAALLDLRKSKKYKLFIIITVLSALYGFFAINGALKML